MTSATTDKVDALHPADFNGDVPTTDDLPTAETLAQIADYPVVDRDGKSHAFGNLTRGGDAAPRVLVVFVRHFFYGSCQEYLRRLSEDLPPAALAALPSGRTSVAVVGCGDPRLIDAYRETTGCPYPLFTDPTRRLYKALVMILTSAQGDMPKYIRPTAGQIFVSSWKQLLSFMPKGLGHRGGNGFQVGGEFLFVPDGDGKGDGDGKKVAWC